MWDKFYSHLFAKQHVGLRPPRNLNAFRSNCPVCVKKIVEDSDIELQNRTATGSVRDGALRETPHKSHIPFETVTKR